MSDGQERRASDARIDRIETRLNEMETTLVTNAKMIADVHAIIGHATSFFKVLGVIGNVVKWAGGVAVAIGAIWAVFAGKNGG